MRFVRLMVSCAQTIFSGRHLVSRKAVDRLSVLAALRLLLLLAVSLAMIYGCERKKAHLRTGENPSGIGRTIDSLTLPDGATGTITGSLASTSGVAAGPYTIHAEGFRGAATSASLGETFTIPGVPVGERTIIVTDATANARPAINLTSGRFGARTDAVIVSDGGTSDVGAISLTPAGTIRGTVIGASPVGTIAFIPGTWFTAAVDETGGFTLEGVPNGSYYVEAERPNYVRGASDRVTMAAGSDLTLPPITIDTLRTPAGAIALDSGAPFAPSRTVQVDISQEPAAGEIMLSEDPSFSGASYQPISETVEYTFARDGPATLYAKFLKNGIWETDPVSDSITIDSIAPNGTIALQDGTRYTHSRAVILAIASDDPAGVTSMIVSENQNFTDTSWITFASLLPFTLSEGDADKVIYLKLRNSLGHESALIHTTIGYDSLSPESPSIVVGSNGYTNSTVAPLTLSATSAVAPINNVMLSEQADLTGASWQTYAASMTFKLSSGDGVKTVYAKFRDAAGNESQIVHASAILDTLAPTDPVLQTTPRRIPAATESVQIQFTTESSDSAFKCYEARGGQYSSWTEVTAPIIFTLASADTWYTLEVRGKDRAGNTSGTASLREFHGDRTLLAGSAAQLAAVTSRSAASSALTLTEPYSPYFLTSGGTGKTFTDYNLIIAAGVLLTVDDGITVELTGFTVNGTATSPVNLSSAASSPAAGDWRSLSLNGTVSLNYLNVAYNRYTILNDSVAAPQIKNSKFTNFYSYGIDDLSTGDGIFTNIKIDCPAAVTGYYGSLPGGASKTFSKVLVQNCAQAMLLEGELAVSVQNSNLVNNSFANIYVDTSASGHVDLSGDYFGYGVAGGTLDNLKVQNAGSPASLNLTNYSITTVGGTGPLP